MSSVGNKKPQEMSMQWLDLHRAALYIDKEWKIADIKTASNRSILEAVIKTFNKQQKTDKEKYSEKLSRVEFDDEMYCLKYAGKKVNVKPVLTTLLDGGGVDKEEYEPRHRGNNMLFFFTTSKKNGLKREIVVLSTGQAWNVVRKCIHVDYPIKIAERILDPSQITQLARLCLFGPNVKEILYSPTSYEMYKTSSLYYLVESITCVTKSTSSFLNASAFSHSSQKKKSNVVPRITATTAGSLRIHHRFALLEYPDLFFLFRHYIYGLETYSSSGELEEADPGFEFLHYIQSARLPAKTLDATLVSDLVRRYKGKLPLEVAFRHKHLEKFQGADRFRVQRNKGGNYYPLPPRPPTLDEILGGIERHKKDLTAETVLKCLQECKLSFHDPKTDTWNEAPLIECLEGEIRYKGEGYFKIRGMWYQLSLDYHSLVQTDFSTLLKHSLLKKGEEGALPNPWKGNTGQNLLTETLVKEVIGTGKGIRAFMNTLVSKQVCFVGGEAEIHQTRLVGEILEVEVINQNRTLIEQELASTSTIPLKERLKSSFPDTHETILKELEKPRKIIDIDNQKRKWVKNPLAYPVKEQLGENFDSFALFLENLYDQRGGEKEETYNRSYLYDRMNNGKPFGPDRGYLVFDQMTPLNIEMCDVVYYTPTTTYLYHVKETFGQHTRDACDQILNGAIQLRSSLSTHQPKGYLELLWEEGRKIKQAEGWKGMLKKQLKHLGKRNFLRIFHERRIFFVYACLAKGEKTLQKDADSPPVLSQLELPGVVDKPEVRKSNYLHNNRLTGEFYSASQQTFSLEGVDKNESLEIYNKLKKFKSSSDSTLAKVDLVRLDQEMRALNFTLKICEIETPDSPISTQSQTPPQESQEVESSSASEESSSSEEEEIDGPSGLENIGSSCYMNATLQALHYLARIQEKLQEKKEVAGLPKTVATTIEKRDKASLTALRNLLFEEGLYPKDEKAGQQDPYDFLSELLRKIQWIPFETYKAFEIEVPDEGKKVFKGTQNPASALEVEIVEGKSLQQLVDWHFRTESVNDPKNAKEYNGNYYNKYRFAERITPLPDLLPIHLIRYRPDHTKITTSIPFPDDKKITIKMGENQVTTYQIVSIINHHGVTIDFGHYTADILDLTSDEERWLHCDDPHVTLAPPQNPAKDAYILFLQKQHET